MLVVWLGSAKASCDCLVECCTVLTLAPVTATRGAALIRSACMLNSCSANLQPREQKMLPLLEKRPPVASLKSLVHFAQLGVAWAEAGSCKLLLMQEALRIIFELIQQVSRKNENFPNLGLQQQQITRIGISILEQLGSKTPFFLQIPKSNNNPIWVLWKNLN